MDVGSIPTETTIFSQIKLHMRTFLIVLVTASFIIGGLYYDFQRVKSLEKKNLTELEYECWKGTAQMLHDSLKITTGREVPVPVLVYFKVKNLEEVPERGTFSESCAPCWILHPAISTDEQKEKLLQIQEIYFNDYELAAEVRAKHSIQSANVR